MEHRSEASPASAADKTARDLQWQELLGRIGHFAASETAQQALLSLRPLADEAQAERAQRRAKEALYLIGKDAALPVRAVPDVAELCAGLVRGASGSAPQLCAAAKVIGQALRLRDHIGHHRQECPELESLLWCAKELGGLRDRILRAIDEHGEILDSASPGVRSARRSLAAVRQKLRNSSQQLVSKYKDSLSGQFVAERGGRFVLPVRADAPHRVEGMILGSSGSGNSLYVEPKELTELNNRVYVAEAELLREEAKVLAELSDAAREHVSNLEEAHANCIAADFVAAIARWADRARAIPVVFSQSKKLVLRQMRHPLLIGDEQTVVANDLALDAGRGLVVSGPNAGGKTVALKCLGLAVWMARSGLPVPFGEQSEVGWFDQVFTDIGDEQSISRSLSTFSAHITRLADYIEHSGDGTLVLLDEICGGTDPEEGSALAAAVLQGFVERNAAVAATTHYERLKQLAVGQPDAFENASVGFNLATMQPTFELTLGVPGQSSALAVAERYGIPGALVAAARDLLPKEQVHQQELLEQLERERAQLHDMRQKTERELEEQRRLSTRLRTETERAREDERRRLSKEARALTMEVLEARALVRRAKEELRKAEPGSDRVRAAEHLVNDAAAPVTLGGTLTKALQPESRVEPLDPSLVRVGLRVKIPHLNTEGEVLAPPQKGSVRVNIGGLKMSVPLDKLALATSKAGGAAPRVARPARSRRREPEKDESSFLPSRTSTNTFDLRGMRVEQGLDQVDGFIDRMLQAEEPAAFFLHGHGTGAMKEALREYVATSPYVSRWEPAAPEDGGDALTVCWL